jgi:proteasome lid subunit RPN8/RPN11
VPVALVDFTAEYDGQLVDLTAGRDWCVDGHPIVRAHPDFFAPDTSSSQRRDTGWRADASSMALARQARGVPVLRHVPRQTVRLTRWAYAAIDDAEGFDGLETGGALLGLRAADGSLEITDASGPGGSERGLHFIRHELAAFERYAGARTHTGARLLGSWHTHPDGDPAPSETDLKAWAAALDNYVQGGESVGMIVTESPGSPYMRVHCWTTTVRGGETITEPAHVEIERGY